MVRLISVLGVFLICLLLHESSGRRIFVCDSENGVALPTASAVNSRGELIGMSDSDGYLTIPDNITFPYTISYQGYDKRLIERLTDTISMTPKIMALPEFYVTSDKTGVRIICLVDEVSTNIAGSDTIIVKSKYIVDFILPLADKAKGFKQQKSARIINEQREVIKRTKNGPEKFEADDAFFLPYISFVELAAGKMIVPPEIEYGVSYDSDYKMEGLKMKIQKVGNQIICSVDALENKKDHKVSPGFAKFLGFTMDITRMDLAESFAFHQNEIDRSFDFLGKSIGFEGILKGKMFKKMLGINDDILFQSFVELKPLEYQLVNNDESKQLHKEPGTYPFP